MDSYAELAPVPVPLPIPATTRIARRAAEAMFESQIVITGGKKRTVCPRVVYGENGHL